MSKIIISEGKTTNEAIEKGLKELNANKNQVEIKVLEQERRSFFDILAPRVVRVELSLKNEEVETVKKESKSKLSGEQIDNIKNKIDLFLNNFLSLIGNTFKYKICIENFSLYVDINGEESGILIGYRGETLNSLQFILTSIANKNIDSKVKIYLNIDNYKEKRQKTLEDLAVKVSKTVLKTNQSITLEPMNAYERKVIHSKLQDMPNIKTHSIGEDPNRKVVIEKVK